ncbi:hypothetical protein HYW46_00005 [Candidatus Daviesbacteria bacterium]|nr:hypothetical protein [Candidatus Daviesbacteria bacterium]
MPKSLNQKGVISPLLIIVIVIFCLVGIWFFFGQAKFSSDKSTVKQTNVNTPQVDKKDKDWMYKYCQEEVLKLPEAPFKYKSKEGPTRSGAMVWISKMFPEGTRFDHQVGCSIGYKYNEAEAYASVGVEHKFDIKYANEFSKSVDELLTAKIDSSWEKISPLDKKVSSEPGYSYGGFPMVFKRENKELGTVEYIDIFFGASILYIKVELYTK